MLSFFKKAVVGRTPTSEFDRNNLVRDEYLKKQLKEELAAAIKRLQRNHITAEHEIDRNDEDALYICSVLEAIFLHGYQDKKFRFRSVLQNAPIEEIQQVSFWEVLEEITHSDVVHQINNLSVTTKVGMCRAWIRMAFNDCLIESYMDAVLRNKNNLKPFFSPNAFLMDDEVLPIAIELLQGLMEFQFHLNYNSSKLDEWSMDTLYLAGFVAGKRKSTAESDAARQHMPLSGSNAFEDLTSFPTFSSSPNPSIGHSRSSSLNRSRANSEVVPNNDLSAISTTSTTAMRSSPLSSTTTQDSPPTTTTTWNSSLTTATTTQYSLLATTTATPEPTSSQRQHSSSITSEANSSLVQTVGNRISLTDDSWGGWSSTFDATPVKAADTPSSVASADVLLQDARVVEPSFDSLLQTYGAPSPILSSTKKVADAGTDKNNQSTSPILIDDQLDCPVSPSQDENVQQMNYEVVPLSSSLNTQHTDVRTQFLLDHITVIGLEKGLDKQSFQCTGCGRPIGLIYGPYRVCNYDGGYYCLECHEDEEHVVPAKIIHNWDFKPYKVAKLTKLFLMKIEEEPLFHMDEINPTLYNAVPELNEVKMLRIQLQHLKGFILTCKNDIAEDFRRRLWPREYMCDDVHQYSALDLVQVHTGQLLNHLRRVIGQFSKHVYKCSLCSQKGFICEICNSQKIIYPFEVTTTFQCHRCLSLFHKKCKKDRRCTKCLRLQFRKKKEDSSIEWPNDVISNMIK